MYVFILAGNVIGKSHRYDDFSFFLHIGFHLPVKGSHTLLPFFKALGFQHNDKLIAAGTEHRTVFEVLADQVAGCTDIFIAGFMAVGIVDMFQSVYIADQKRKFLHDAFLYFQIHQVQRVQISLFALHPGHSVLVS